MALQTAAFHQQNFNLLQALGSKLQVNNAVMAPVGFEGMNLLIKQFPHPIISGGQEIESYGPGGLMYYEQAPIKTAFQGPISFYETEALTVQQFMIDLIGQGGYFDARIYEGTLQNNIRAYRITRAFISLDAPDRDMEARGQLLVMSGTITYNYFGPGT